MRSTGICSSSPTATTTVARFAHTHTHTRGHARTHAPHRQPYPHPTATPSIMLSSFTLSLFTHPIQSGIPVAWWCLLTSAASVPRYGRNGALRPSAE